jgi:hypothetical protein
VKSHLNYHSEKTTISVRDELVEIKAHQIIVWVSLSVADIDEWDERIPKFPAILDIGHTHAFALTEHHLRKWAGIHVSTLSRIGTMRKENTRAPLHRANLWLHMDSGPLDLVVDNGIAIFSEDWPSLPILGSAHLQKASYKLSSTATP